MLHRLLLIAFLVSAIQGALAGTPSVGDFLPGGTPTPPEGCKLDPSSSFSVIDNPTPTLDPGKEEFSIYYFFLCPSSGKYSSLVIWRTRHYQQKEQLVGSLTVPPDVLRKAYVRDSATGVPFYFIKPDMCFLRLNGRDVGRVGRGVNALVTTTSCNPIHRKHALIAWRVDGMNMKLIPVLPEEILDCGNPGPDC